MQTSGDTSTRLRNVAVAACIFVAWLSGPIVATAQASIESLRSRSAAEGPHLLTFQTGIGVLSLLNGDQITASIRIDSFRREYRARANGSLAYTLVYDYRITPVISLGGAIGLQQNRIDDFRDAAGDQLEGVNVRVNRTLFSVRALFHYGKAANFEMYSGLRVGMTIWSFKLKGLQISQLEDFDIPIPSVGGALPHAQFIPFGCRGEIAPGLSLGGEIALGSPHFVAAHIAYRF